VAIIAIEGPSRGGSAIGRRMENPMRLGPCQYGAGGRPSRFFKSAHALRTGRRFLAAARDLCGAADGANALRGHPAERGGQTVNDIRRRRKNPLPQVKPALVFNAQFHRVF